MIDWPELALRDRTASGFSAQDGSGVVPVPAPPANPLLLLEVRYRSPRTTFLQVQCNVAGPLFLVEVGVRRSVLKFQQAPIVAAFAGGVWASQGSGFTAFAQWLRVSILPTPNLPADSVCQAQCSPSIAWPEAIDVQGGRLYSLLASGAELMP